MEPSHPASKGPIDTLVYLFWAKQFSPLFTRLSTNILREVSAYLPFLGLAYVSQDKMCFLDYVSERINQEVDLRETIHCDVNSRWTLVRGIGVFLCGGGTAKAPFHSAYILQTDGLVKALREMTQGHTLCGVISKQSNIYVFGSVCSPLSEEYPIQTSAWKPLPNMHYAKWSFNPVLWQSSIYLCQASIEAYDGHLMKDLHIRLPDSGPTLVYILRNSLYVLSNSSLTILSAAEELIRREHSLIPVHFSYSSPVVYSGEVLIYAGRKVHRFGCEDGEMVSALTGVG